MATSRNCTEVLIGGKVFTLSGFESEDYLQKVSTYLNHKIADCASIDGYNRQTAETRNTLLALNIADDYFKAKSKIEDLERELRAKENELYDLKHELIATQIKLENTSKSLKEAQEELNENSKSMVRMETELKEYKKLAND